MSDVICCPLSECDENGPKVFTSRNVCARKNYKCTECEVTITRDELHQVTKGLWDDRWSTFRTCLLCVEIREHFACDKGWLFNQLWSDLEDNFFPDMRAGGPCMEGLSPKAKGKMFDMRLAWELCDD